MFIEAHYTGKDDQYIDRMVAVDEQESYRFEVAFMVGAGVNCGRTARDYSDPLQKDFPCTYSEEATETIIKGLYKAKDGPKAGYWSIGPENARLLLARTIFSRSTVVPQTLEDLEAFDPEEQYWVNYGEHNNAN